MNRKTFPCLERCGKRLVVTFYILALAASEPARALSDDDKAVSVPPGLALKFSPNPTTQEIFHTRIFEEPLVPIGGEPSSVENAALSAALLEYSRRTSPDDFASLTRFLERHPKSSWCPSLLTGLGFEYYNTAHYSLALDAWSKAWTLSKNATDAKGKVVADRTGGELAYMFARLGRMTELDELLKSVEGRVFVGPATEKISGAREGLWNMQHRPEISFRCGPLALHRIKATVGANEAADMTIFNSASTQKGMSLPQVAELSTKIGLNYQMAFREKGGAFIIPSVVHWKVGHYAALTRCEGHRLLLQDPTFGNDAWATTNALESEATGYFLIPSGPVPKGWRVVDVKEGEKIWGKGVTTNNDPKPHTPDDPKSPSGPCKGMAVSSVHLMLVNLNLSDEPVGYSPPVGAAVRFTVRYNHREAFQPAAFTYANFGPKWTCDWVSYINDNPQSPAADVNHYVPGGGTRTFTGFDTNTQRFVHQQYDQSRLTRTGADTYELVERNGSKLIFSRSDGATGTSRKIFLAQIMDPFGNPVTLNYDAALRLTNIVDAIGQATTLSYTNAADSYKITRVTDPFGRFASFEYDNSGRLTNITDVIGIKSRFIYEGSGDFINALVTPYGTTSFTRGATNTTRWLETLYPDGSRERVEFNQGSNLGVPFSEPISLVPQGMSTGNGYLYGRNTFYWSRTACATDYGDYSKAKIYHWLHTLDLSTTAGILESTKEPLEGRVWYDYDGQSSSIIVGSTDRPKHVGRVLDDGSTQLYTYGYNGFGNLTNSVDPLGRTFSYIYATNGIDLLEVRMTRASKNELLSSMTYNAQHLPLTTTDAAGQTITNTYNARGQLLTISNPNGETTTYGYNSNGYLIAIDGPLPGTNDTLTATYDSFGRTRTKTDESGYTVTLNYDALNRITNITFPDSTFYQFTYDRLDVSSVRDRGGRQTFLEYDALRNLAKRTDPLGRVTRFQWCNCGSIKSLTDPMGRTTEWEMDVQGRLAAKQYGDGTKVSYFYENASGRLRQVVDEKLQIKQFAYNRDNTLRSVTYQNAAVPTPAVTYAYDPDFERHISMTDGIGTTLYSYVPISGTPTFGAGQLASVDGPYASDTFTYAYDQLGRRVSTAINGVASAMTYDAAGRKMSETNALGSFSYSYDGSSRRVLSETFPNSQTTSNVFGNVFQDFRRQQMAHQVGGAALSKFIYDYDIPEERIASWSQQAGTAAPDMHAFTYDDADRLLFDSVTNSGSQINAFAYSYDPADNRLLEVAGAKTNVATYNALNQLSTSTATSAARTNEWDAEDRLVAVNAGTERTEFLYNGQSRLAAIRRLTNGVEASFCRFVWRGARICEQRDASNNVTSRYFAQGMKIETGPDAGSYFYTRDHLGSVRELTDSGGAVRARYSYDPYGRRSKTTGDLDADLGFAGMFWSSEAQLYFTLFRAYDPALGRWLSRDPLENAEVAQGVNLYWYAGNDPVNAVDPLGLCCEKEKRVLAELRQACDQVRRDFYAACEREPRDSPNYGCRDLAQREAGRPTTVYGMCLYTFRHLAKALSDCMSKPCNPPPCLNAGVGGGKLGGGFPDLSAPIGNYTDDTNENVVESTGGRSAERHAAGTAATAERPPGTPDHW